jgi:hypothetical protein
LLRRLDDRANAEMAVSSGGDMRAKIYAALVLAPGVLVVVSVLFAAMAAAGPCPSSSGGGC